MQQTKYQIDPSGVNPNNLVVGEVHTVLTTKNSTVVPMYGAYFTDSLIIYDVNNLSNPLTRGVDYICLELVEEATAKYGQEICQLILVIANPLTTTVSINYQVLGAYYSYQTDNIETLYNSALSTNQGVDWYNVLNKPLAFVPSEHINMLEDIYGFEPVIYALERIKDSINLANSISYQALIDYISGQTTEVTKQQVDLGVPANNYVGYDMLLYFIANFIGDSTLNVGLVVASDVFTINITSTNLPTGFRIYWDMSDRLTNQIYSVSSGVFNIKNDTASFTFTVNGSLSSNSLINFRFFSSVGPVLATFNLNSAQTSINIVDCFAGNLLTANSAFLNSNTTTI